MKGSMLKRSARKPSAREKRSSPAKISFQDPVGHVLPPSLASFRWNVDKVERKLQEKIQEKTKIAGNFVYQQAYRLLECTRGEGIDFASFREQLRIKFGIILDDGELQLLFDKYDEDRNGTIDLNEFIRRVLPPDYNYGRQWFELSQQESEDKQAALKRESRHEFLLGMGVVRDDVDNTGETSNWTLETLMKQIQAKVVQKTPSGDDQYRRAFKMLRSGRDQGIRMRELRNNLKTKFGIFVSEKQMKELFSRFDMDGSGEIDLKEFLQFVEPPAYPGNSKVPRGLWTEDDEENDDAQSHKAHDGAEAEHHGDSYIDTSGEEPVTPHGHEDHEHDAHCCQYHKQHYHRRHQYGGEEAPVTPHPHGASGPSTSTKNVIKKERPMSANPKKQALLKQRREQNAASTTQLLERHLRETTLSGQGHQSVTKATQTRRLSMSMVDIHHEQARPSTADGKRQGGGGGGLQPRAAVAVTAKDGLDDGLRYAHRCVEYDDGASSVASSATTYRPRSAGSVAGSSASSVAASVRGASYMRRPSTPQHLRQKCLESRLAGATGVSASGYDSKPKKRVANAGPSTTPTATATHSVVKQRGGQPKPRERDPRRHAYADHDDEHERYRDDDEYESETVDAPRVVRVHPKQHDPRPYSQGGRVLLRSKVSSAGCR